jgi:hypothetical protein
MKNRSPFALCLGLFPVVLLWFSLRGVDVLAISAPGNQLDGPSFRVNSASSFLQVGEELTYQVSYLFVKLGQIRLVVKERVPSNGGYIYRTAAYIDSYPGIPFISLHSIFESDIDEAVYSRGFVGSELKEDRWRYLKYDYDYPNRKVFIESGVQALNTIESRDTLEMETVCQDGLSLFYFARANVHKKQELTIPTLVVKKKVTTYIDFLNELDDVSIDAVDYRVDAVKIEGKLNFVGLYGLTGDFKGWFSADSACVPIKAKMRVYVGSVNIELRSWNRPGWKPPKKAE